MARLSFRCSEELLAAVDAVREHEPREHWLRRAVERALDGVEADTLRKAVAVEAGRPPSPAPAEQLREFRPYPKGGNR